VNCSRIKSIDRFNDKEPSLFARESTKPFNKQTSSSLLKIESHLIRLSSSTAEHRHPFDPPFQTNLTMPSRPPTEERSEEFRTRFSQTSDADSSESRTESPSAASFIHEDDESFAETVIPFVSYET